MRAYKTHLEMSVSVYAFLVVAGEQWGMTAGSGLMHVARNKRTM
jgi:hypothetical protein